MPHPPAIEVRRLTKRYGTLSIFEDLDFTIPAGERVALVGASGAGKSTILHLIGGLDRPTSGEIRLHGQEITTLAEPALAALRNRRSDSSGQLASLLPEFTALENAAMPLLIRGTPSKQALEQAAALLEETGLAGRSTTEPESCPAANNSAVSLARAWWHTRVFCSPTSPPARWTSGRRPRSST